VNETASETGGARDLALPVEDLLLSVRSCNCLKRQGIRTVGDLIMRSEQDLLRIQWFGAGCLAEVRDRLVLLGLELSETPYVLTPEGAGRYRDREAEARERIVAARERDTAAWERIADALEAIAAVLEKRQAGDPS
jgi:Bacterial RNA polymerase, alpha chain C terminal domain